MDSAKLKNHLGNKIQNIQNHQIEVVEQDSNLKLVESGYMALGSNTITIIRENMKNMPISHNLFDTVKSPSGGITVFSVPGISGDEICKELTGIILDYTTPRAYWQTTDPIEGALPDCFSRDSVSSIDGKTCVSCQYNEFGSKGGDSKAKACKESVEIFLLRQNNVIPLLVRIPVSSKGRFQKYLIRLVGSGVPIYGTVTKITLEKSISKGGKPYALYNFEAVGLLGSDETEAARDFGRKFSEMVNLSYGSEGMAV